MFLLCIHYVYMWEQNKHNSAPEMTESFPSSIQGELGEDSRWDISQLPWDISHKLFWEAENINKGVVTVVP